MDEIKYSAYINDKLICFSDIYSKGGKLDFPGVQILSDTSHSLERVIEKLVKREHWTAVVYLSSSPKRSWQEFVSLFQLQEAAGGIVRNELGEHLIIYRRGKWDLPKGKIDYDESPAAAALREVKEECGLEHVELGKLVEITFHSYPHKHKHILKKTHWYFMQSHSSEKLIPQTDEDIDKVIWMNEERIRKDVFANTYLSVKNLLEGYLKNKDLFEAHKS